MLKQSYMGRALLAGAALLVGAGGLARPAAAQWSREYEQFYLPAKHNWVFRQNYSGADRLFNAFDYGHAILYEELYTRPGGPVERLEEKEYDFLTRRLLKRPPRVPLAEGAIEVAYAKLVPEAKNMFHWAHVLHRQIYDVLADERLSQAEKDAAVAEVLAYYKSRPDVAFSSVPKSMDIMDGHYYSLAFREKYPKFNGLIWAYHWLQVGLYEPLLVNGDVASRTMGVNATVGRFWQMLENAPETMPYLMPMTAGVAPAFAARYPEASIIFDNLHMMHDVISDILASPRVPREKKREEILKAAAMFRDDTSYAISVDEWMMMGEMMGVNNMGGPAGGFLAALPQPTVPRGMSMAGMDHSRMPGTDHAHAHGAAPGQPVDHAAMGHAMPDGAARGMEGASEDHLRRMMEMHERMMADPVIRARAAADPVLQQMMAGMHQPMPAGHATHGAGAPDASDAEQAMDFIVRLLSDPAVEARIHHDPRLHQLWSDPEVQRRLAELRRRQGETATRPAPAPHRHR
ncbi:MAG TPA: hypothetical protein VGR37_21750 [Longimicrobiaceae bacterium]|nr:hypothetical protein [Longimicrobiaceae bacterium]